MSDDYQYKPKSFWSNELNRFVMRDMYSWSKNMTESILTIGDG